MADLAKSSPGVLTRRFLQRIHTYVQVQKTSSIEADLDVSVSGFVTTLMQPTMNLNPRTLNETRTLAYILDELLSGRVLGAADAAVQRLKSLEMGAAGDWSDASLVEVIPPGELTLRGDGERAFVARRRRELSRADPRGRSPFRSRSRSKE
jgi:hypothetical protein